MNLYTALMVFALLHLTVLTHICQGAPGEWRLYYLKRSTLAPEQSTPPPPSTISPNVPVTNQPGTSRLTPLLTTNTPIFATYTTVQPVTTRATPVVTTPANTPQFVTTPANTPQFVTTPANTPQYVTTPASSPPPNTTQTSTIAQPSITRTPAKTTATSQSTTKITTTKTTPLLTTVKTSSTTPIPTTTPLTTTTTYTTTKTTVLTSTLTTSPATTATPQLSTTATTTTTTTLPSTPSTTRTTPNAPVTTTATPQSPATATTLSTTTLTTPPVQVKTTANPPLFTTATFPSTTTVTTPSTTPKPRAPLAFTATREDSVLNAANPVILFDNLDTNLGNHYSTQSDTFTAPEQGVYYHSLCAGAYRYKTVVMSTTSGTPSLSLVHLSTVHTEVDAQCRGSMQELSKDQKVTLASTGQALYSDNDHQIQWSVFSVSDSMPDANAFAALRSTNFNTIFNYVTFDNVFINEKQDFDGSTGTYTCPSTGTYFFSFSVGVSAGAAVRLVLDHSVASYPNPEITRTSTTHNGLDTLARVVLLQCNAGDTVRLKLFYGTATASTQYNLFSFCGFRYSPVDGTRVAWAAYRTSSWSSATPFDKLDLVTFDIVHVNEGGAFAGNKVTIPQSGYYFIAFSVGALNGVRVNVDLLVDNVSIADVVRSSSHHNGEDTLLKELVLKLTKGKVLHLRSTVNTGLFSDSGVQTSFIGLLLYTVT